MQWVPSKHTNRVTQGPIAMLLNPACPSEIDKQQRRDWLGVDSDLVVAISWSGCGGKVERECHTDWTYPGV